MIHVTRSFRPEVVLFGHEQRLETPLVLEAGKSILVKADAGDKVTVSRFVVGQPDQKRVVSTKVDEVIRAIVELGGTYPDVVQALQQAKTSHALASRFEVDALPDGDRAYRQRGRRVAADESIRVNRTSESKWPTRCPSCSRTQETQGTSAASSCSPASAATVQGLQPVCGNARKRASPAGCVP